jgi:hypothetical protein
MQLLENGDAAQVAQALKTKRYFEEIVRDESEYAGMIRAGIGNGFR